MQCEGLVSHSGVWKYAPNWNIEELELMLNYFEMSAIVVKSPEKSRNMVQNLSASLTLLLQVYNNQIHSGNGFIICY